MTIHTIPAAAWARLPGLALNALVGASAFTLFFLMLVVPTVYQPVKAVLLVVVVVGTLAQVVRSGRVPLHPLIACGSAAFVALGLVFVLRGIWLGAPGAVPMVTVYVVWPAVYTVLLACAASHAVLNGLGRLLVVSTIVISLYSLSYIAWELGWWPDTLYLPLDQGQGLSVRDGTVEFNLYSITSLIFLVPYVTALLIVVPSDASPASRPTLWLALALGVFVSILSGRRALLLVMALAPFMAVALRLLLRAQSRSGRRFGSLVSMVLVVLTTGIIARLFGIRPGAAFDWFASGFQFSSDPIAMMRATQSAELLTRWWQSPLLGWGFGSTLQTMVRSAEMPWAFELSYLALLLNTGAVGVFFYAVGIGSIFFAGYAMARSGHQLGRPVLAVLVGSATFLVANATNPYLPKFDYEWVVFLPLAFINVWLLDRDHRTS